MIRDGHGRPVEEGQVEVDAEAVRDAAHPHGYLLLAGRGWGGAAPADVEGWRVETDLVPGARLHLHTRTVVTHERGATGTVVLLGHPVDVELGSTDGHRIASRLTSTWDLLGEEGMVREAAELGGRWTLVAASHPTPGPAASSQHAHPAQRRAPDTRLLIVPDTHASQPVFHAVEGGRFALGSTPALVAQALDLTVDESALSLLEELRTRRKGMVTYLPGRRTPYLDLDTVVPNCLLRVDLTTGTPQVAHERFWPWREREEASDIDAVEAVHAAFRERLTAHTALLASLGRPAVSLTAGLDSRVTAAVGRAELLQRDGLTFTYVNPRDARAGVAALTDVTGASAVAAQLGLPHRVLRWRLPPAGGTFDVLHRRTYAPLLPSRGAAHAMWADLPRDLVQLQSNCAETGTAFIRRRTAEPLSPLRLARMMMHAEDGLEDLAEQMYGGYLEHAQMTPERMLGYDHHDLFYWEQRIGRWGWQKFTDGDFGHRILLPFNDRVLLETMLSLPYARRASRELLERVVAAEPRVRVPRHSTGMGQAVTRSLTSRLPGALGRTLGRRVDRVVSGRAHRAGHERLAWARGYAVLPAGPAALPESWVDVPLPGSRAILHKHPALPHAIAGSETAWVLVLGEPVGVTEGLDGADPVAERLAGMLSGGQPGVMGTGVRAGGLARAEGSAATLAGSWVVVLQTMDRTMVLTDPLVSLGLHLTPDTTGLVSHLSLAGANGGMEPGSYRFGTGPVPVPGSEVLVSQGCLGITKLSRSSLTGTIDLESMAQGAAADGWTRRSRLDRHLELLRRSGPPWLALDTGSASAELLELLAAHPQGAHTLTWWDRTADDAAAEQVVVASRRAVEAGLPHRVVGVREDVDGSSRDPGDAARRTAAQALATTWASEPMLGLGRPAQSPLAEPPVTSIGSVALSDAVAQTLPTSAVLLVGAVPPAPRRLGAPAAQSVHPGPHAWDLVQGVRRVGLPFSDRLLPLLPE